MNKWPGLPRPRWMTQLAPACVAEEEVKSMLNAKDAIDYKNKLQQYSSLLPDEHVTYLCPQCRENNGLSNQYRAPNERTP